MRNVLALLLLRSRGCRGLLLLLGRGGLLLLLDLGPSLPLALALALGGRLLLSLDLLLRVVVACASLGSVLVLRVDDDGRRLPLLAAGTTSSRNALLVVFVAVLVAGTVDFGLDVLDLNLRADERRGESFRSDVGAVR